VFGFGEQDGMFYYVMPLIGGRPLDELGELAGSRASVEMSVAPPLADKPPVARHPLDRKAKKRKRPNWRAIADSGRQDSEALACAHAAGIVHRDIKPGNLLLEDGGRLWVTDFGLAKPTDGPDLTAVGDLVGTIRYMAPERFHGRTDFRCDIWSLGLTLFELA